MQGAEVLTKFTADTKDFDSKAKKVNVSLGSITKGVVAATGITKAFSAAWNLVTGSMDNAIDRLDTMNNYPKVLKNFGVSAEDASESVDRIDQSVRGLPTSLDQAIAGVQDLFVVTKDLKQSEKLFQAINDSAMVFANGSTQAVDRFIYAFKQSMAQGKVSAQDFNQMNEAIPGIMDKVAEAMGISFSSLKSGLSEGTVSIDQFNSALKELDENGGAGMVSLQEAAKSATGGIKTSITNMKTAVTRGVADIIKSVDEGLANAGLGGLSEVISSIGQTIEKALKTIAPYITDVVVVAAEWLPKIVNTLKEMSPYLLAIGGIIAAWKVGSTINGIVKGFQEAKLALALFSMEAKGTSIAQGVMNGTLKASEGLVALLTGKMTLAQLAQSAMAKAQGILNAVMSANPIGLIVAGIVALIAIVVLLWNKCEWFRNGVMAIFDVVMSVVKTIFETVTNIASAIWEFLKPIFDFIKNAIMLFIAIVTMVVESIYNVLKPIFEWIYNNVIKPIIDRWTTTFNAVVNVVKIVASTLKNVFSGIVDFVKSAFDKIKSFISNIFSTIGGIIKAPINGVINGINAVLKTMNKIKIPNWVPGLGGKGINFKLIPKLDKGTNKVLGEGLAYLHEGEAVVPKKYNPATGGLGYLTKEFQKLVADTMTLSPNVVNSASLNLSPKTINYVHVDVKQDSLGQFVNDIKTFSGGAKNDYNYGAGV